MDPIRKEIFANKRCVCRELNRELKPRFKNCSSLSSIDLLDLSVCEAVVDSQFVFFFNSIFRKT